MKVATRIESKEAWEELVLELYKPHPTQLLLHNNNSRFRVAAWGRQAGKSSWGNNEIAKSAWETPRSNHWFVAPTFSQAKVQFRRFIGMIEPSKEIIKRVNETDLFIQLINGSTIFWKSGEVFDNLRGDTLHSSILDEYGDQRKDLWPLIIRPMLTTTRGRCTFIGTPKGFNHFYDKAEEARTQKDWFFINAPSTCNPLFTQEEFDAARRTMSESQFAQEILAEFRDLTAGKAYLNFGAHNLFSGNPFNPVERRHELNPYLPILVGLDFNLNPMAWNLAQKKGNHIHFYDEIYLMSSHTQEASEVLVDRVRGHKPGVILVGDASGRAGQRAAAGQSDYDILCQALDRAHVKWINLTPESNPIVKDRVNIVNARLKSADGTVHVTVDPERCPRLKRDFERVTWKEGQTVVLDKSDPELTHSSDGASYLICQMLPLDQSPVAGMKVIVRSY